MRGAGMKIPLGMRLQTRGTVLVGTLTVQRWKDLLIAITDAIGMTRVYDAACWKYPVAGKGGTGHTIVQPITESFMCLDVWDDHNGAYLFLVSCKPFSAKNLYPVFLTFGLTVHQEFATELGLPNGD
jgi:hypothetical protein